MEITLRQWHFGDEEALINLFDHYDRSCSDLNNPKPGECNSSTANWCIRQYVDMTYNDQGFARAIEIDGKVIGHVQYSNRHDIYDCNCDLEIFLLPEACGRGIGSEVVTRMIHHALDMNQNQYEYVCATILSSNKAARRMAEKVGMECLGEDNTYDALLQDNTNTKLLYGIRRPPEKTTNIGVEIKKWEYRDIDELLQIYETVDKRYDDLPNPLICHGYARSLEEIEAMDATMRLKYTLLSMHSFIKRWKQLEKQDDDLYRAIINNGKIVGLISVSRQYGNQSLDGIMGYMMMPEHSGKGIATKAVHLMIETTFKLRKYNRLSARVYRPNIASSRVLEKNGFKLEGVLREAVLCEGHPTDYLQYGLLRSEYQSTID